MVRICVISWGMFIFAYSSFLYFLGTFNKTITPLALVDMRWLYPTLGQGLCYVSHGLSVISYPMCAQGIHVSFNYLPAS